MVNQIRSDESLQILVFVVLPLLLLLVTGIFTLGQTHATFNREVSHLFRQLISAGP
jgi:hypothetical protein